MKKLIAISVMLALITGAVFAETSIGGNLRFQWNVVEQWDTTVVPVERKYGTSLNVTNTQLDWNGSSEDGKITYGFRIKEFQNTNWGFSHYNAQWQLIDALKLYIGTHDGWFGFDSFAGWGFHQGGNDGMAINEWWGGAGNNGSFNNGIGFEIKPMDGLAIMFGLPIWKDSREYKDVFNFLYFGVRYGADGIGTINVNYQANFETRTIGPLDFSKCYGSIGLGYENGFGPLTVLFLGKVSLGTVDTDNLIVDDKIQFGATLGLIYDGGDFGVKFRFQTGGLGLPDYKFAMAAHVMPYYKMSMMEIRCNIGVDYDSALTSNAFTLFLNPYVMVPVGGPTLMAGLQIDGIGKATQANGLSPISFKFPVVLNMGF